MPTVWLVEDNPAFRRAVARALAHRPPVDDVQAFECCEDALAEVARGGKPDVILVDVGLPGMDGLQGIHAFKTALPDAALLVLTVFEDDEKIFRAIRAGASGYLLKSESMDRVAEAIEHVLAGGSPMNPRIARRVLEMFSQLAPRTEDYGLNDRELAALKLMVEGCGKKEIADKLGLNQHTSDYVIRCIYRKLHVNGMTSAVSVALKAGLIRA